MAVKISRLISWRLAAEFYPACDFSHCAMFQSGLS